VTLTPRAGFVPASPHAALLKHINGKLWIDKQDLQWSKGEAYVIDLVSIGLILARIGPGARITLEMSRVAEGIVNWMRREECFPRPAGENGNPAESILSVVYVTTRSTSRNAADTLGQLL
jgi:hypothetical protein